MTESAAGGEEDKGGLIPGRMERQRGKKRERRGRRTEKEVLWRQRAQKCGEGEQSQSGRGVTSIRAIQLAPLGKWTTSRAKVTKRRGTRKR